VKSRKNGFVHAKGMPLRETETISVFSNGAIRRNAIVPMKYNPQGVSAFVKKRVNYVKTTGTNSGGNRLGTEYEQQGFGYPTNLLPFKNESPKTQVHPTQKPVPLMEYLIKTYTQEGEVVLDFTMGSGTTGVACVNTNRKFIGIEKDEGYFKVAKERIESTLKERKPVD
jgi:site-specific DNA-methyltransferase (adenine-specific)